MWEDLSFKDRSKLIELGASQGILDLSTIKHLYNINADGGYLKWKKEIAKHKGINIDNDKTYNYQAFFEEDPQRAWDMLKKDSKAHFTDKYKTVWHPTFSDESVYSGHKSKYNPQGLVGGHWEGNTFRMSDSLYNSPVSMDERQQYLIDNEPNGASLLESNGTLPVYDGIPWGGVLPEVTITPQYSDGGSIHIAKNKRGTFKAQASRMGMSTQQAASHILANNETEDNNQYANGGHIYRIPKHRKVAETIKMTNGNILTREVDNSGYSRWFRNGKYITPSVLETYKFYDKNIGGYRQLKNGLDITMYDRKGTDSSAPVYTPTINNIASISAKSMKRNIEISPKQQYKPNGKYITLKTKGNMNLVDIPTNMLDSIAINTGRSNTNIKTNLGLIGKESTFGGRSHFLNNPWSKNDIISPYELTNNHSYFIVSEGDYIRSLYKYIPGYLDKDAADRERKAKEDLKHHNGIPNSNRIPHYSSNIMADAFKRYTVSPSNYNRGQGNYIPMVNAIGNEVWNEPHIQNWWNTEGKYYYNKGRSQGINYTYADGGPLESDEDNLLAPIIKYYEDSNPYLSIEDQNTFAKGGQMKKARQAVDYFVNKGLTKAQAAGLVGNLMRESGMNIAATNPNSGAYGLGQWLGNRKTRLFRRYGYHPTFEQQLDYIWDELNTSHRRGLQMLRASKTVNDAARNAFGYYEFSAGPEAAIRAMNGAGKNTKWKNPNGTYALNSGIKNAQMIFGEVPVTMDNTGDTLAFDTPESMQSTPNIQPIISNDYAPVTTANLKELPTFGQEEDNDSSIPSFGPLYLAQNLDRLGITNPLNPFEKGYQLQSPKAIYANMQGLI